MKNIIVTFKIFLLFSIPFFTYLPSISAQQNSSTKDPDPTDQLSTERQLRIKKSKVKNTIRSMIRAQQATYLEAEKFASKIEDLGFKFPLKDRNYQYSIVTIAPKKAVQIIGLARKERLKSFTAIVFITQDPKDMSFSRDLLCESDRATIIKPKFPKIQGDKPKCPSGYSVAIN
jgi:Type IV pilin-like G and H, putative